MPSTEHRSQDEWLAAVIERGRQIRRRRRLTLSAVGALALLVPALAFASAPVRRDTGAQLQVAAAGPAPTTGPAVPPVLGAGDMITSKTPPGSVPESAPPADSLLPTTTVDVQLRVEAIHGRDGPPTPTPNPTPRIVDDPVIRPAPAAGTVATGATAGSAASAPNSGAAASPTTLPELLACPAGDVRVTVSTDKATYAPGETVRFSSTLENRSATACLVSGRAFFSVENGAGSTVSNFAYTANFMMPVKAEPGQTFTNSGTWDQRDCSGSTCVQAPAGPYVVVAGWTEGGPYSGRGSIQISA